jgi:DNA-binding PucR family transcriptional regulator
MMRFPKFHAAAPHRGEHQDGEDRVGCGARQGHGDALERVAAVERAFLAGNFRFPLGEGVLELGLSLHLAVAAEG